VNARSRSVDCLGSRIEEGERKNLRGDRKGGKRGGENELSLAKSRCHQVQKSIRTKKRGESSFSFLHLTGNIQEREDG